MISPIPASYTNDTTSHPISHSTYINKPIEYAHRGTLLTRIGIAAAMAFMVFQGGSMVAAGVLGLVFAPHATLLAGSGYLLNLAVTHVIAAINSGSFFMLATGSFYGIVAANGLVSGMDPIFFTNAL